ncbi:hypothetical protein BN1723_019551, partial [Verticillium longisporum]
RRHHRLHPRREAPGCRP